LLPVCRSAEAQVAAIEGVVRAVEAEEIGWKALDAAAARIRVLKERFLFPARDPDPRAARAAAGSLENVALAMEIGDRAGLRA
ncbi:MAG TPA: hypothetical protein VK576_09660, partial [Thermoleophilia bacterium]|nr:hypothetical protein [Thermoleophilia bacterium]